ncbi:hypothetical protein BS17DRAFT_703190, partial [Gyrodon lividus]
IPASSVPCKRLFSGGAEIATDWQSRLGAGKFEELQMMKHVWCSSIIDWAASNSQDCEEIDLLLDEYEELLHLDEDLAENDCTQDEVIVIV